MSTFLVDKKRRLIYKIFFNIGSYLGLASSKKNIQFDDGTVDMVIKDGILYTLSHSLGIYVDVKTRVIS